MTPKQKAGSSLAIAGAALLAFVSHWEGTETVAYADKLANNLPTVCNGHTGPDVRVGDVWTKEQCDAILVKDATEHGQRLLACITVPLNQNQYNALASFAFNVGTGNACKSTLVKLLNQGQYAAACDQLLRWNREKKKIISGLDRRRRAERELCLKPVGLVQKANA